jgi:uncharacterized membrane protein YkvA (DUF1232 family)
MMQLSPRRLVQLGALWRALRAGTRPGAPALLDRVRAIPRMVSNAVIGRYPGLGLARVALIALAVAYLVSPVDLVPEAFLTVFGLGDDAVVAMWLGGVFLMETQRFLEWERGRVALPAAAAG